MFSIKINVVAISSLHFVVNKLRVQVILPENVLQDEPITILTGEVTQ